MTEKPNTLLYSDTFQQLWKDYSERRYSHEEMKRMTSEAWKKFQAAEAKLAEFLLENGNPPIEIGGMKPYLSEEIAASVTQENEEEVRFWLQRSELNVADFEVLKLDGSAVKRYIRNRIRDGVDPTSFPEFMKVSVRPRLNVRGWDKD